MLDFSIIIPVYNIRDYLAHSVESILANDTAGCEILLVDDGSTDGTADLCEAYARDYPDLIRVLQQPNGGPGAARNTGIDAARGEWLLFIDGDDTLTPDALAVLRAAEKKPGVEIIGFQFESDDGEGHRTPASTEFPVILEPFTLAQLPDYLMSVPSVPLRLWARTLFVRSGLRFPAHVWYEDVRTTVKLFALATGIVSLPNTLYRYVQRHGSIMHDRDLERNRDIFTAFDDILNWYREAGQYDAYRDELCGLAVRHILLAATVRIARQDPRHPLLGELRTYMDRNFPDWPSNRCNALLPKKRALLLRLIRGRHYRLVALLFRLKG